MLGKWHKVSQWGTGKIGVSTQACRAWGFFSVGSPLVIYLYQCSFFPHLTSSFFDQSFLGLTLKSTPRTQICVLGSASGGTQAKTVPQTSSTKMPPLHGSKDLGVQEEVGLSDWTSCKWNMGQKLKINPLGKDGSSRCVGGLGGLGTGCMIPLADYQVERFWHIFHCSSAWSLSYFGVFVVKWERWMGSLKTQGVSFTLPLPGCVS